MRRNNDEQALIREVRRQVSDGPKGWAWVPVGKGQTFHRTTVRRAITNGKVDELSYGVVDGCHGYQLRENAEATR